MTTTCELIEVIGKPALTRLQAALGPASVYLPTKASHTHPVSHAIGMVGMTQLCNWFGGSMIWIGNGYAKTKRNQEISQLLTAGVHPQDCAAMFGITTRQIRVVAALEDPMPTFGLTSRRIRGYVQGSLRHDRKNRQRRNDSDGGEPSGPTSSG